MSRPSLILIVLAVALGLLAPVRAAAQGSLPPAKAIGAIARHLIP